MKKEKKDLKVEELEKRAAPLAMPGYTDTPEDPAPAGGGGAGTDAAPDQPGNSDGHRDKLWKKGQ